MQLSAEQMAEFATALRASDRQLPHDDRRRTPRMDVRARIAISMLVNGERRPERSTRLRDLSPRGVALLHDEAIERGQHFLLTLPRNDSPPVTILCVAVHCRPLAGRLQLIGAEFVCTTADKQQAAASSTMEADLQRIRTSMLQ